ncbi:MAG TPA: OadG family protein [Clostridiales bacterium]|nr:OadG family protein [Clostridiales bacterium]
MHILYSIGEVVIPGLLIVFLALVIMIYLVMLASRIIGAMVNKKAAKQVAPQASVGAAPVQATAPAPAVRNAAPAVAAGIPGETVAAISAAVACYMQESAPGVSYAIQSISRPRESRPVWGFAGMLQNTRPF